SALVEKVGPLPIWPSRSDTQRSDAERSPSVASRAPPEKMTPVPTTGVAPAAGAVMVTAGAVGDTVSAIEAVAVAPSESVTVAVIVWLPSRGMSTRVAPVPRSPLRLDVQWICALRLPSKSSLAVAWKDTVVPAGTETPLAGAVITRFG